MVLDVLASGYSIGASKDSRPSARNPKKLMNVEATKFVATADEAEFCGKQETASAKRPEDRAQSLK
jgi:hypothetical protein